jgi:hypothetical protein
VSTIHCAGCGRRVDVTAPPGAGYEIRRGDEPDGRRFIEILVGRVIVHRCVLCRDGVWR